MAIYTIDDVSLLVGPVEFPVVPGVGLQLPGNAVELDITLPTPDAGHLWVWQDNAPVQVPDNRGTVYHTETGAEQQWILPGDLPSIYTPITWPGAHHIWNGEDWLLDKQALNAAQVEHALSQRDGLLAAAAIRIAPLEDAVELGIATQTDEAALREWKIYRVDLNRIENQEGFPSDIAWPSLPAARRAR
ncbi:hypothetical protein AFK24_09580 [Pseudomonas syringae]|uniref:Phage tail protein n=1 Tax=Pseudomonas syringae TaxID=317 RepID=A0A1C7Z808_PSESX|nr:tail fiber assembly protein [Pseudomonas syringae]OCR25310.1 hypothetical protein AFK24_09580 [Pseudomonas syringae]